MHRRSFLTGVSAAMAASRFRTGAAAPPRLLVFFGTRDAAKARGIYSCFFDLQTSRSSSVSLAGELELPTWLAASADARYLYSVSEVGNDGKTNGSLAAFAIDRSSGGLRLLNKVSAGGGGTTYVSLDATGKTALAANYGSGRTTAFRVLPDGRLGEQTASMAHSGSGPHRRQAAPHAHAVVVSPDNRFVLAPDLGADRVFIFRFDAATGALSPNNPPFAQLPAGSGPRQMVFHPSGKFAYLMNELVARIAVFAWDARKGSLSEIETVSSLAAGDTSEPSGAGIAMHRAGRFLYTTTRNDNAVEVFAIDGTKGALAVRQRAPARGQTPWSCAIDPAGLHLFVMNQASDSVAIFRIDPNSGDLRPIGDGLSVPAPACALFVPGRDQG